GVDGCRDDAGTGPAATAGPCRRVVGGTGRRTRAMKRRYIDALGCVMAGCLAAAALAAGPARAVAPAEADARRIVVAISDRPDPVARAGSTPRGYGGLPDYDGSGRTRSLAVDVAADHRLREVSAWTIHALQLRCMLYELPEGVGRDAALAALRADARVRLAQPLNRFETLGAPRVGQVSSRPQSAPGTRYNDP